jgi:hypothetical protein
MKQNLPQPFLWQHNLEVEICYYSLAFRQHCYTLVHGSRALGYYVLSTFIRSMESTWRIRKRNVIIPTIFLEGISLWEG